MDLVNPFSSLENSDHILTENILQSAISSNSSDQANISVGSKPRNPEYLNQDQDQTQSCSICFEQSIHKPIHELCSFCESCLTNHVIACLESDPYNSNSSQSFQCPTENCSIPIKLCELFQTLSQQSANLINESLTRIYIQQAQDVITCPNSTCKFAGFYTYEHLNCKNSFVCGACQIPIQHPIIQKRRPRESWKETLTDFMKAFKTKRCPSCYTQIIKMGGCDHMVCGYCKADFNWSSVSYTGWRILINILFMVICVLAGQFRMQILELAVIIAPYLLQGLTAVIDLIVLISLLVGHFFYILWVMRQVKQRKTYSLLLLIPLPFSIEIGLCWLLPTTIKTVVYLFLLGYLYVTSIGYWCVRYASDFVKKLCEAKVWRKKPGRVTVHGNMSKADILEKSKRL